VTPLVARDLYRFFHAGDDEALALRGVSLAVERGEIVAVTGPSGSGKSTLLACLAGLDEPDGGTVTVDGERLSRRPEAHRAAVRARTIGMLYQHGNLVGHLSVEDNVAVVQSLGDGSTPPEDLLLHCGIAGLAGARPAQLSGGELARAGLALALANDPAILLADEPTGELDATTAKRVLSMLRERADDGMAIVVVTHDAAVAGAADREVRLRDGQVVA
jgi:putative ABC transport system ATP-binding protein